MCARLFSEMHGGGESLHFMDAVALARVDAFRWKKVSSGDGIICRRMNGSYRKEGWYDPDTLQYR